MNDPDSKLQKVLAALVCCMCVFFMGCGSTHGHTAAENYSKMTPEEIVDSLTLEQKTAQMLLPAVYNIDEQKMSEIDYGAVLSKKESLPASEWRIKLDQLQTAALDSQAAVPYLYGQDDVHGVNYCLDTVIFPHNIALGAANDPELTKEAGRITAMEAARCHMLWNFAPTVAVSCDPRWGRTYECYSSDPEIVKNLGRAYTEGLVENGVVACAKHFLADGSTIFGTGPDYYPGRLFDRGNAELSEEELKELLGIYQAQIDAGVQTIMISDSSVNGIRMSEHKELLRYLKEDMGFDGFLVTDWNAVKTTSAETYKEKIITVINSGTDMLMEVDSFEEVHRILIDAVYNGDIPQSRIDDAARRIIKVKKEAGLFENPFQEDAVYNEDLSACRSVAEKLVEESLVLIKNNNHLLPIKSGTSIYITGPACNNAGVQCGGWTLEWQGTKKEKIEGVTTLLDGFVQCAENYNLTIITDPQKADEADVVLLAVGEKPYAEYEGDSDHPDLLGKHGLEGNLEAMEEIKRLNKPVIACIIAGRNTFISKYADDWDSIVMCWLPGSQGQGIANVLLGDSGFSGKLPSPWYDSIDSLESDTPWLPCGYGLTYSDKE